MTGRDYAVDDAADHEQPRCVIVCKGSQLETAKAIMAAHYAEQDARCVCGLTRRQHETQWPACRGFVAVVAINDRRGE